MNYENLRKFLNEITDIVYRERIVVVVFLVLGLGIQVLFYFLDKVSTQKPFEIIVQSPATEQITIDVATHTENIKSLFPFRPATVSYEELLSLGFSEKTAHIFLNYRNKGGQFYNKEDVKKIYGVSPELFSKIEPYIIIETRENTSNFQTNTKPKPIPTIDINTATLEDWKALPGIGDYFAQKFITIREGIGAYQTIEQIAEVYKLPDSTFQKIKPYLKISQRAIKKININTAPEQALRSYPYILRWQADDILRNRPIYGLDDLYELKTFREKEKYKNIVPYFDF